VIGSHEHKIDVSVPPCETEFAVEIKPSAATVKKPVRFLLVDDSDLTRERTAALLNVLDRVQVVGQAADVLTGLSLLRQLSPEVLVLDVELPGSSGLEMLEIIQRRRPSPLVTIMLTSHDHPKLRERCAELGANFFFHKLTEFEKMLGVCQQLAERWDGQSEIKPSFAA
jgi:DNA-binding NarL/FixJ family response regulator